MSIQSNQNWFQRHAVVFIIVAVVIIVGLGGAVAYLLLGKHSTAAQSANNSSQPATSSNTTATTYKLTACKSGTSQTLGNAEYLVGTDLAPGNYTVKDASTGSDASWTNVDIYAKQSDFKGHNDGNTLNSLNVSAGDTSNTMLKDGEYVSVWADSAVFTCQ